MVELIKPLTIDELEDIQTGAELESFMGPSNDRDPIEEVKRLAKDVLILSAEIQRLRYTYGESFWQPCNKSKDEILKERMEYQKGLFTKYKVGLKDGKPVVFLELDCERFCDKPVITEEMASHMICPFPSGETL